MITTVSLNPAIDKTILLTDFERGGVNRITSYREDIGGKGINVAKILNRLEVPSRVCGFIGSQNRTLVADLLSHEYLDYDFIEVDGLTRTNTKIVELDRSITTDLNEPGFYINEKLMPRLKEKLLLLARQSDYVVFSGSIPQGLSNETYKDLITTISNASKAVLDADGPLLVEGMEASPYMIKPNIHELEAAFDISLDSDTKIISFGKSLAKRYGIHLILVSMGEKGSLLITENECFQAGPIKVEVKSTVGAGDSMLAGMLYGIHSGLSLDKSLAYAAASGTLAVTKEGTQSFSLEEVRNMLLKVHVTKIG
ncbi:MAG TPA: 1-phosphofructokinase [Clostridiales bacterium]|nr:1-phosphofructokinase [Clostridiales bacterium]